MSNPFEDLFGDLFDGEHMLVTDAEQWRKLGRTAAQSATNAKQNIESFAEDAANGDSEAMMFQLIAQNGFNIAQVTMGVALLGIQLTEHRNTLESDPDSK